LSRALVLAALLVTVSTAAAHVGHGSGGSGFPGGFMHPLTGIDHLAAMLAVGLWGAQLRSPAIWILPVTFPMIMALGAFLGLLGMPLPAVEAGVALSGVALGICVALALRPPLWAAMLIVAAFGFLHGHAHGTAIPLEGSPLSFGGGFVVATGLLHLSGILIGLLVRWPGGALAVRGGGVAIALAGGWAFATWLQDVL
jgi:urease accessory protein